MVTLKTVCIAAALVCPLMERYVMLSRFRKTQTDIDKGPTPMEERDQNGCF